MQRLTDRYVRLKHGAFQKRYVVLGKFPDPVAQVLSCFIVVGIGDGYQVLVIVALGGLWRMMLCTKMSSF